MLGVGILLRVTYVLSTDVFTRAYDTQGHIEYITHLFTHGTLPELRQGWESWQPPLYYIVAAAWMKMTTLLSAGSQAALLRSVQLQSLLLSLATLAAGAWIAFMLFPKKNDRLKALLFLSIVATFPGLVFFASRIGNDVLLAPLSFIALGFLLRWWKTDNTRDWYSAFLVIVLGIFTKANALPLAGIAWTCLLLRHDPWRKKIILGAGSAGLLVLLTGWFFLQRYGIDRTAVLGANMGSLHSGLRVENTLWNIMSFHPVFTVLHPFNNTWMDSEGRQFLWDFVYRSAFFGEFSFPPAVRPMASAMLISGMAAAVAALAGALRSVRDRNTFGIPCAVCAVLLLSALACYRLQFPFSCTADFRYAPALVIPLAYFAVEGAFRCRNTWLREALTQNLFFLAVSSALFLSLVSLV